MSEKDKASKGKRKSPVSKLMPYLKRKKVLLYSSIISSTLSSLFGFVPYLVVYMISIQVIHKSSSFQMEYLTTMAAIALGAVLLKGVFFMLAINLSHKAAYDVLYHLRMDLADKLTKLPLGYFDRNDVGVIKHTMNEDVEQLEEGVAHLIPDITTGIVVPLVTFIVMFVMDWKMSLLVLIFLPILTSAFIFANKKLKPLGKEYGELSQMLTSTLLRYVYGMKVIRAFSQTERAYEDYSQAVNKLGKMSEKVEEKTVFVKTLAAGLANMTLLIVVPVGVWFYSSGKITAPIFIIFILLTLGIGNTLFKAFRSSGQISFRIAGATNKVLRILEEKELPQAENPQKTQNSTIAFHNVSFSYNEEKEVLRDVTFTAKQGTLTALVGSSGAGKTTIARLVPRFWDVTKGSITIGDADIRSISSDDLLEEVSYVFQDIYLFDGTIMDNIRIGRPDATDEEVIAAAKKMSCHDFIVNLANGYQTIVGEGGERLSGGQRQRISIIRAYLKQAPILILDEATALIDPENEAMIQDAIMELMHPVNGQAKTILMIAHRLHTVVNADQILVIEDGTVIASGTHPELLSTSETYRTQWETYTISATHHNAIDNAAEQYTQEPLQQLTEQRKVQVPTSAVEESSEGEEQFQHLKEQTMLQNSFVFAGPQYKKKLLKSYFLSALDGLFLSIPLVVIAFIIYAMFQATEINIWLMVAILVCSYICQWVTYYITNREAFPFYQKIITNVRLYLGKRLKNLPYGFFIQQDASSIEMRIKQDAMLAGYLPAIVSMIIKGLIAPLVILSALFYIDWVLAFITVIGIPFCFLLTKIADSKLEHTLDYLQVTKKQANKKIVEFVRGISVIRAFGIKNSTLLGYKDAMDDYRNSSIAIQYKYTPFAALNMMMFELGFIAVLIVGGYRMMNGSMDEIQFISFLVLTIALYEPLPFMDLMTYKRLVKSIIMNLNEIILEKDLQQPTVDKQVIPEGSAIAFKDVRFGYNEEPVLQGFTLRIPEKGVTALVGPSGGGKTTALHLIARFWDVDQGQITIDGIDVRNMRHDTLMRQISPVFQDIYLTPDTVLNNLKFGRPDATMEEVIEAAKLARCHEFIMELPDGYQTMVSDGGGTLSGGQKQRISIARAILKNAPIVLLDEATASIDPENEKYIQEAIQILAQNKTVIIVAHRIHTIQKADQIAVVEDGQVKQVGTHRDLIEQAGLYQQFWHERIRAEQWKIDK